VGAYVGNKDGVPEDGKAVGRKEGENVGVRVGICDGRSVCALKFPFADAEGRRVGTVVGVLDGLIDGCDVGLRVGWIVGWKLGVLLGFREGNSVGVCDGLIVGM
jgi:hypothetical protein